MKVLYLTPGHPAHDAQFDRAITQAGHTSFVCTLANSITDDAARRDVVRGAIAAARPDVIHAGPIQSIARLAAEVEGHPLVAVSWGFDLLADARAGIKRDQATWTLQHSEVLLVDCEAARTVAQDLGMPEGRIVTLPWGVDVDVFRPARTQSAAAIRTDAHWDDKTVVVMTRALEPLYGVDVALSGFLVAAEAEPELRLLIVGGGSLRESLEEQVDRANAASLVRFAGERSLTEMPDLFGAADIYLSASHVDGSSVSLLEAMATGLPAIVSDVGGNAEWVEAGRSGYVFADGDAGGLAEALKTLAQGGPRQMRALGKRARRIAEARADWSANAPRLFGAYEMAVRITS